MHFGLPPRKSSFPPPYARVSARNSLEQRRRQIQYIAYLVLGVLTLYLLLSFFSSGGLSTKHGPISEDSTVAIVTVLDESSMSNEYMSMIRKNRDDYAARHGRGRHNCEKEGTDDLIRIHNLLHERVHLCSPNSTFALIVVAHTCPAPCTHEEPGHRLRMVAQPICLHHESFFISVRPCFFQPDQPDAQGHSCGTSR